MNSSKRTSFAIAGGAAALLAGLGWLIWSEYGAIDEAREGIAQLRQGIEASRKLMSGTPQLEKEVIVLRETEQAIKEILPDDKDLYNLHRDLQGFCESSEVRITSIKKKDQNAGRKKEAEAFEKVTYELTLEGDAFQVLSFLDRVEGHTRFLRIPTINWSASGEKAIQENGRAAHKVKLEVETFVYKPQGGPELVKIEGYARKRELLLGEISKHRDAVAVEHFSYRGQRGRRDPWVDPRVPTDQEDASGLSIQEQSAIVDSLVEQTNEVKKLWVDVRKEGISIVEQMQLRAELETLLTELEEQARKVVADGSVRYGVAESRLHREALEPMATVRSQMIETSPQAGPPEKTLRTLLTTMQGYLDSDQPKLALEAFATVETQLAAVKHDPVRKGLADSLRRSADEARILVDFQQIDLRINGIAIQEGVPPVALINGKALSEGDLVKGDLLIQAIRPGEIEFVFRGLVLVRRF